MSILIAVLEIELLPMLIILASFKESRGICVKRPNNIIETQEFIH